MYNPVGFLALCILTACPPKASPPGPEAADADKLAKFAMVHARGAYCPPGWRRISGFFAERDGSHRDACRNPKGPTPRPGLVDTGLLDYLAAGESFELTVPVPLDPPQPVASTQRKI